MHLAAAGGELPGRDPASGGSLDGSRCPLSADRPSLDAGPLFDRGEAAELGDVAGVQFGDAGHLEQLHCADDLVAEDVDRAVDAGAAAGHEAVEVGAADEGEARAEGDRRDDVGAVHDAGVDGDLGAAADGLDNLGQQVEGDGGAVELAAAVVGKHDPVDAEVGQGPGVLDVLHALDDDLAGPQLADDVEVLEVDGGVHGRVEQLADGAAGGG